MLWRRNSSHYIGRHNQKIRQACKGEETVTIESQNKLCSGEIGVTESHKYEISQLGTELHNLASSKSCRYEIVKHNNLNIFGTQFHPEMSTDGQNMIESFLSL